MSVENVSEKQIIDYLIHKQHVLKSELKKVELALEALKVDLTSTISNPIESYETSSDRNVMFSKKESLLQTKEFQQNGRLDSKIAFALTERDNLTKDDILELILKHQPELNRYKFEKSLAVRLSFLIKNEMIRGNKIGRNYIYRLCNDDKP